MLLSTGRNQRETQSNGKVVAPMEFITKMDFRKKYSQRKGRVQKKKEFH